MVKLVIVEAYLKKYLSNDRYLHCKRVMDKASLYAKIYKVDVDVVKLTALAHDLAREFTADENFNYIKKYALNYKLLEKINYPLLHGFIAADIVRRKFQFTDEMCSAIKYHTTGKKNMTMLEKIVFLADKLEDGRDYPDVDKIRDVANTDIDKAMYLSLENSINYCRKKNVSVHPLSLEAFDYYKNL